MNKQARKYSILRAAAAVAAALTVGLSSLTMTGCSLKEITNEVSRLISEEFNDASSSDTASSAESKASSDQPSVKSEAASALSDSPNGATYTVDDISNLQNVDYFADGTIEHIFIGTINRKGKATGYHYTMVEGSKGEIIEGTRTEPDKNGVFTGRVKVSGIEKTAFSSFYPESWSPQQVVDAINAAYEDAMSDTRNPQGQLWIGHYGDIEIDMYFDDTRHITTAYPVYQGD